MRHDWRARRVAVAIVLCVAASVAASAEPFRIATFNCEWLIRGEVHRKFDVYSLEDAAAAQWATSGFRDARFAEAVDAVARNIIRLDADLIVLVEVGDAADVTALRDRLAALGRDYPHIAMGSTDGITGQHVAALSIVPFDTVQDHIPGRESYLPEPDDIDVEEETGITKGLYATLTVQGQRLHLYGAHFKSERGGHEADMQRVSQASIMRRNYLPHLRAGEHVIVAGDLNDHPGQPALLRVRGLDDIDADLIQTGQSRYFARDEVDQRWTYIYNGVREQIDHILISGSIRDACKRGRNGVATQTYSLVEAIQTAAIPGGPFPASDHRPLVVELDFR